MEFVVVCSVALVASVLTFFTGFGLGTLLLPAFAAFFPAEIAIALTAVVHLLNSLFKLVLVGRRASLKIALRFGVPAIVAAFGGALVLQWLTRLEPLLSYELGGRTREITPVALVIALLMIVFALAELRRRGDRLDLPARWLPVGGLLTGFFGGLSGHQGALRSAFLLRAGLDKEAFIATGVVIAAAVDLTRLTVYASTFFAADIADHGMLLAAAAGAAFAGAFVGSRVLKKISLRAIEVTVAVLLFLVALGLGAGLL
jgi:hypothetical protein